MHYLKIKLYLYIFVLPFILQTKAQAPYCTGNICLTVVVDNATSTALITIQGPPNAGWVGVGIGTQMKNANVWVFWKGSDGSAVLIDGYALGHSQPFVNPNQTLQLVSSNFSSNPTVTFRRNLVTGIAHDNPLVLGNNDFIWATCPTPPSSASINAKYQMHDAFGTFSMNILLGTGQSDNEDHPVVAHGILMFIAWALAAPTGVIIARFLKPIMGVWWFRAHISLMGGVVILFTTIAYFIMYASSDDHFDGLHQLVGIVVFICCILEGALGVFIDRMFDPNRHQIPFSDKLHWWTGRILLVGGLLNIYLGLFLAKAVVILKILYGIWLVGVIGLFLILQLRVGQKHHGDIPLSPITD